MCNVHFTVYCTVRCQGGWKGSVPVKICQHYATCVLFNVPNSVRHNVKVKVKHGVHQNMQESVKNIVRENFPEQFTEGRKNKVDQGLRKVTLQL